MRVKLVSHSWDSVPFTGQLLFYVTFGLTFVFMFKTLGNLLVGQNGLYSAYAYFVTYPTVSNAKDYVTAFKKKLMFYNSVDLKPNRQI